MRSAGRRTRSQQSSPGERRTLISLGTLSGIASFASVDRRVEKEHGTCEGKGRWDDPKRMSGVVPRLYLRQLLQRCAAAH